MSVGARDRLLGRVVGKYRLESVLGRGGMGTVYKAVHVDIGARVAIKVLSASTAGDPAAVQRLLREAQLVNQIEHDGVIKVSDAGRLDDDRPYLVLHLVDGQPLSALVGEGRRRDLAEAARWCGDLLDAVAAAHAAGIVHRDLKPGNVMLTRSGRIVVLDFGVAKLLAADSPARLTVTGATIGTPEYMAPEQLRGQAIGPATDLYAVGVMLFEMVCGRRPFLDEGPLGVIEGHVHKRPPPPRALRPEVPMPLQEVILAALAKDPARRPASAAAMRDAVRAAVPALAAPAPAPDATVVGPATITDEPWPIEEASPLDGPPTVPSRPLEARRVEAAPARPAPQVRAEPVGPAPRAPAVAPARRDHGPEASLARAGAPELGRRPGLILAATAVASAAVAAALVWRSWPADGAGPVQPGAAGPARPIAVAPPDAAPVDGPGGSPLVQIHSAPPDAVVYLDDLEVGRTPYLGRVTPGPHQIRVARDGHDAVVRTVTAEPGSMLLLDVELMPRTSPGNSPKRRLGRRRGAAAGAEAAGTPVELKDPFSD